eukprot:g27556.t1
MASDDLLDVDAGWMVNKDKGNPITVAGGKRRGDGRSAGYGLDPGEGPVDNGAGESSVEEEGGHVGDSLVETGLNLSEHIGNGEWRQVRVQPCTGDESETMPAQKVNPR